MKNSFTPLWICLLALCAPGSTMAQPANDGCGTALLLTVSPTCTPVQQDAAEATQSADPIPCDDWEADQANDMWYRFTGNGSTVTLQATGVGDVDLVMEAFSGSCEVMTSLDCADMTYDDGGTEEIVVNTALGIEYLFRVYPYLITHADYVFTVCAIGEASSAGVDEPSGASPLRVRPQPSHGNFTVSLGTPHTNAQLDITDMSGRVVHSAQYVSGPNGDIALSLEGRLAVGTYALRTSSATGVLTRTIVVD